MYFVNFKRIPQQAKIIFVAKSAILLFSLIIAAVLKSMDKQLKHGIAQNRSKKTDKFTESATKCKESGNSLWNP